MTNRILATVSIICLLSFTVGIFACLEFLSHGNRMVLFCTPLLLFVLIHYLYIFYLVITSNKADKNRVALIFYLLFFGFVAAWVIGYFWDSGKGEVQK